MTNLKQLKTIEKVTLVHEAWTMFLTGFAAADRNDSAAVQMISNSLESGKFTGDMDVIDNSNLESLGIWILSLLRTANEGNRQECTKAAASAIDTMARKLDRSNPVLARAIRNV